MADYDPLEQFSRSDVSQLIKQTKAAITAFQGVDRGGRRAFAAFVFFELRKG